jgi:nicotinate phosphoribosyltransferase
MKKNNHFLMDMSDIPLLDYSQIFVNNMTWLDRGIENDIATFDLVVRDLPPNWNFYIFDGLERFVDMLLQFRFDDAALELLKKMNYVDSPKSVAYYKNFKFTGEVSAMKDGTIFFPGQPIVRITAPAVEANMLTAFIMNAFSYPPRILTKSLRVKLASGPTIFYIGSLVRLPGFEQGIYTLRAAYLLDSQIGTPFVYRKFPELTPPSKITSNINHAFIKSFSTEQEAFRYFLDILVKKANFFYVMVDTYELKKGLASFIEEIKKTPNLDRKKVMITIDSGDLKQQAHYVREQLDKNDLREIRIQVMSSLDEYSIDEMVKSKTPIDCYISSTALINITDCPKLELVYKMAELKHKDGAVEQKAKLTKGKESFPGRKQVFRVYKNGKILHDIIGLEDEKLGRPLLEKIIENGKLLNPLPGIEETKAYLKSEIQTLPDLYKSISGEPLPSNVKISEKLNNLLEEVKKKHLN